MGKEESPYVCPSCGREYRNRSFIKRHFYNRKTHCPRLNADITLTDEIKEYVLENRIWRDKDGKTTTKEVIPIDNKAVVAVANNNLSTNNNNLNNIINTYNTINNFVSSIDPLEKLKHYTAYNSIDIVPLEDKIDQKYAECYDRLINDKLPHYELSTDDLYDIIDELSHIDMDSLHDLNVIYDESGKKIVLYDGEWRHLRIKCAIKNIFTIIKTSYTNAYEAFLIRRLNNPSVSTYKKQLAFERLTEYYKFLGSNDVIPGVKDEYATGEIDTIEDELKDKYYEVFKKTIDNMTKGEENKIQKEVLEILRRNSKKNLEELNRKIIGLFQIDEDYKKQLMDLKIGF